MSRPYRSIRVASLHFEKVVKRPTTLAQSRWIGTSTTIFSDKSKARAAHPSEHSGVSPLGRPVADLAKEDESKITGTSQEKYHQEPPALLAKRNTPDLFSLQNRSIIITGGGRGLGLTIAQALLESGANVFCADILPEPSEPSWSESQKFASSRNLSLSYTRLDITDPTALKDIISQLFDSAPKEAPIRGLYVSAGIQLMKPALDFSVQDFRKVMDVNVTGSFLCAQAFAKEYISRNEGKVPGRESGLAEEGGASIVMTGSMSGHIANYGLECVAYNPSKAAVNQLAKNLAMEWGKYGIRVNTLSPGYIRTAMTAALLEEKPELNEVWLRGSLSGRLSTPDEFRGPVTFLLSDASSFMTGADILVDGGHTAT